MLNEEATQWPPYVENKRGIPTSLTPYKECMIDRRKMPNALRGLIQGLCINEIELVVRSVPDTIVITQYLQCTFEVCSLHFSLSLHLALSAACSLHFKLTIFKVIASKVQVKSELY